MPEQPVPQFVEDFGLALAELGFARMPARVFALLLATPEESLTARELADQLGVSAAAISGAVRYLVRINLVRRTRTTGERVDRYGLGAQIWEPVFVAEIAAYGPLRAMCEEALASGELGGRGSDRVAETSEFLDFMATEMTALVDRWRGVRDERRSRLGRL